MRVQVLNGVGRVAELEATRVLILQDDGTIVCVAAELIAGAIQCAHALDPEFRGVLTALGINRTTQVIRLRAPTSADIGL